MQTTTIREKKITKAAIAKKLGVSRQSLYYTKKQPLIDEEVRRQIEAVLTEHKAYGHKRIAPELKLNKKRVLRVMKKFHLKPYRLHAKTPIKKEDMGKASEIDTINIYKLLCPIAPNIVWVSDFTYIKFQGRFIYVATIMDMYTREIIGVSISRFHNQNLVMEAFMDAEKKTKTHSHYLHSDQGSEYTSDDYKTYVVSKKMIISFSDKASPWQNGFQESFYGKFKVDLGHMEQFSSTGELIEGIYQTMYYYNNKRRHTSLHMSPVQFKLLYQERSFRPFV
ncbi:MAG: IS3 family transposase [Rhabdochlamydiaceae bacterium]